MSLVIRRLYVKKQSISNRHFKRNRQFLLSRFVSIFAICTRPPSRTLKYRSSHPRCVFKKGPFKTFLKFTKNICVRVSFLIKLHAWGFKKRSRHRLLPVNLVKLLRTSLLQNTSGQLLLEIKRLGKISVKHFCKSLQGVMYKSTFIKKSLKCPRTNYYQLSWAKKVKQTYWEEYWDPCQRVRMERFVEIVNVLKPLSLSAKHSILDDKRILDTPLLLTIYYKMAKKFRHCFHIFFIIYIWRLHARMKYRTI